MFSSSDMVTVAMLFGPITTAGSIIENTSTVKNSLPSFILSSTMPMSMQLVVGNSIGEKISGKKSSDAACKYT